MIRYLPWQNDRNKNDPICIMPPKVAKASTIVTVECHCRRHFCLKNIANAYDPLLALAKWQKQNDPICIMLPKVAKASTIVIVECRCRRWFRKQASPM